MAHEPPFPQIDWSHLPLDWYDFIGGEAIEHTEEPLMTDKWGYDDGKYYSSLPCWTVPTALQLMAVMNLGQADRIKEAARLSYSGRDGWLMISLFPEKDEKRTTSCQRQPILQLGCYKRILCMANYQRSSDRIR